jgi:hypothetical protein
MNTKTYKPVIIRLRGVLNGRYTYLKAHHQGGLRERIVTTRHASNARGFTLEEAHNFINANALHFGYQFEAIERTEVAR